jgi:hypothetical protein
MCTRIVSHGQECWSDWDKDNERNGLGKINFRNGADIWSRSYAVAIAYGMWMIAGFLLVIKILSNCYAAARTTSS